MSALAEHISVDSITFTGLPTLFVLRLPVPLSDQELIAFSRSIRPYQVERNADGELEVMSPNGFESGRREIYAICSLGNWAEEHGGVVLFAQAGFTMADKSVRMADASWITEKRWSALKAQEEDGFVPSSPNFLIEILSERLPRQARGEDGYVDCEWCTASLDDRSICGNDLDLPAWDGG
jgi:Uma2 family endonuclease